jgi:hypothetical protein
MFSHKESARLERIELALQQLNRKVDIMAQGLTDLQAADAALKQLVSVVIAELQTLQQSAGDPDATVESIAQDINASIATIQAAIPAPGATGATGSTGPGPTGSTGA